MSSNNDIKVNVFHFYGIIIPSNTNIVDFTKKLIEYLNNKEIPIQDEYKSIIEKEKLTDKYSVDMDKNEFYDDMFWSGILGDVKFMKKLKLPFYIDNNLDDNNSLAIIFHKSPETQHSKLFSPDHLIELEDKIFKKINKFDEGFCDFVHSLTHTYYGWHISYNLE